MNDPTYDKSQRSVFVGNIPYEATEEKLKEIFCEVGPVQAFKLVYDRENGKPKGYGFCEFKDPETAMSAMRNLNGYEIGGRTLRVDTACTEKSRMEMQNLMAAGLAAAAAAGGAANPAALVGNMSAASLAEAGKLMAAAASAENPYGAEVEPEKAPEAISKAVASLPPEQMFELMKQMKLCIQNNPDEARRMLNQNPQLAYALLQAQVVMRCVEPDLALNLLHKAPPKSLGGFQPPGGPQGSGRGNGPPPQGGPVPVPAPRGPPPMGAFNNPGPGGRMGPGGPMGPMMGPGGPSGPPPGMGRGPRQMNDGPPPHAPFGGPPPHPGRGGPGGPPPFHDHRDQRPPMRDPRDERGGGGRDPRSRDPRGGGGGGGFDRGVPGPSRPQPQIEMPPAGIIAAAGGGGPSRGGAGNLPPGLAGADPDKAKLIMEVLKLTDEQIEMLPQDQKMSILELKKHIHRPGH